MELVNIYVSFIELKSRIAVYRIIYIIQRALLSNIFCMTYGTISCMRVPFIRHQQCNININVHGTPENWSPPYAMPGPCMHIILRQLTPLNGMYEK